MKTNIKQFIDEMETETFIRENESKWEKWEEEGKRLLILGLGGDWYYKDQFLQDMVQEVHGEVTKDLALWENDSQKYYDKIFLRIYKDHKTRLLQHYIIQ
tara:strand:+ start:425 stop:724 length:300 start_codon:yes stop_codon:yes gene_type:complete